MTPTVNVTVSEADKAWLLRVTGTVVCVPQTKASLGFWHDGNPLRSIFSMYLLQFILVNLIAMALHFLLRPLRQTKLVCYFLAGIILSPNVMGRSKILGSMIFQVEHLMLVRTVGFLGIHYFLFLLAVKIDFAPIRKSLGEGIRITILNETTTYLVIFGLSFVFKLPGIKKGFFHALLAVGLSVTRFPNVAQAFNELNILSSELGQLAVSCTITHELIGWWWLVVGQYLVIPSMMGLNVAGTIVILMVFFLVIRPGIWSIIRRTPEGTAVKEGYIILILVGSLVLGVMTSLVNTTQMGLLIFGLIIPNGPPLGSTVAEKAELFMTELLLPMFYVSVGFSVDIFLLKSEATIELVAIVMLAALAKLLATALSSYFLCDIPFHFSLLLGLMMNIKGPFDMLLLYHWILSELIDRHAFTALALSNILLTAMVTPWIDIFYNPHTRLIAATGKNTTSFLNTPRNVELRVLCCIQTEDHVTSIISLLEALNPTKANPVSAYVVHLNELVGLAPPDMLPYHKKMRRVASKGPSSIMRAFENYSRNSLGMVSIRPYTVIAPYKSMHEYICRLALQEVIPLVIIPYQTNQHTNTIEVTPMKIINSNVQTYSPCTIGVLVDKGIHLSQDSSLSLNAAVLFVSGNDDHEALAFGIRMTGRPNVRVSVIRIIVTHQEDKSDEDKAEKEADNLLIDQFLHEKGKIETDAYHEISAENTGEVMLKLRGLDLSYDLIIVGRQRKNSLLAEDVMRDWSENPELGVLGDLISSDQFKASVLVMQHSGDINVPSQSESNESEGEHLLRTNS